MKKISLYITIMVVIILGTAAGWLYYANYLERETPAIKFNENISSIGKKKNIGITFTDAKSGLSHLKIEIVQDNKGQFLVDDQFSKRGINEKILQFSIDTVALKLHDGPAIVNIMATDHSLFKNKAIVSIPVKVDTVPPQIAVLNPVNYLNQGGTGFIAYRVSKPPALHGVYVNDSFSPGFTLLIDSRQASIVYFAVPMDASRTTKFAIFARDDAGNETTVSLPCTIKNKKFRSDKVNLSDSFLQQKMSEFQSALPALQGKTPLEVFGYINTQMRSENFQTIQNVCKKSSNKKYWEGTFHRMRNASPMALFGDQRTYLAGGKSFGNSIHLGVDLASTAHAPIEAANNGVVVFVGPLGIYGNAVILDHGLGVFSLYGHLSNITTTVGKNVRKEEVLGQSGLTGLAGGDHLHFSIIVGGQFVNPQEWWDMHWIEDNINKKMFF